MAQGSSYVSRAMLPTIAPATTPKLQELQAQINTTTGVMNETLVKLSERGERIEDLYNKSDNLSVQAKLFERGANKIRKRMCCAEMKMRAWVLLGTVVLIISLAGVIFSTVKAGWR